MKTFNLLLYATILWFYGTTAQAQQALYQPLPAEVTPQLSASGSHPVGVKTITVVSRQHPQLLSAKTTSRLLTLEIWYPAIEKGERAVYENVTRSHNEFRIEGQASRDTAIAKGQYPLVILSHGYTGYRHLMFYLGEHLASHGYIVAAVDHTDSTNQEIDFARAPYAGFPSTLYNRARDQQFTLDAMANHEFFVAYLAKGKAGLVGYSMGGYGLLSTLGGCFNFSAEAAGRFTGIQDPARAATVATRLNTCAAGQNAEAKPDKRWAAGVALAPWGGQDKVVSKSSLNSITTPVLYVAGDQDDISGYDGIRWLFHHTGSAGSQLLTIHNARHNIAGHPAPANARSNEMDIGHYYEPAWDTQTLNNITKHFVLAMMNCHIKEQPQDCQMLEVAGNSNQTSQNDKTPSPGRVLITATQ
ncbi:alpha/beta hydrolase family protein [Salinimonas marina]|uniref:alpha/beta hydrolase family protein n=1 Tax=Salinimonas marina TaxID=2785918 RepID=UPI001E43E7A2|nr:acetylhydrolase [Salinimonas marina]